MRCLRSFIVLIFFMPVLSTAQISNYKSTDNEGLNKKERIDSIEKYLTDLSGKLKDIEAKIELSSKKMISLEVSLMNLSSDFKKNQEELQVVLPKVTKKKDGVAKTVDKAQIETPNEETSDLEKVKADLAQLKNQDLDKLKNDMVKVKDKIQEIELNINSPSKK